MLKYFWLKVVGFSTVHLKCAATLHLPDREKCNMTFESYNSLLIALRDNDNEILKVVFFNDSFTYKSTKTEMSKIISILKINTCRNLGLWSKPASQTYDYAAWNWFRIARKVLASKCIFIVNNPRQRVIIFCNLQRRYEVTLQYLNWLIF